MYGQLTRRGANSRRFPRSPASPGVTVIWPGLQATERPASFRRPGGASRWHTDLVHERQPAGITHLHNDTVPPLGGDTLWASGYAAYEKLSPGFRALIDGRRAVYRSAHAYLDRDRPGEGPKFYVEREHPLVRVHPATGWKALWVNRAMTDRIVGLDRAESDLILGYLYDVYERNVDIQVRFRWTPRTSALWDNRITIHNASWDYGGRHPRHGTRVTSLAEVPYFDASAPTRREALGLLDAEERTELGLRWMRLGPRRRRTGSPIRSLSFRCRGAGIGGQTRRARTCCQST